MEKQFSLIIGSSGNNTYMINFRCWVLDENNDQITLDTLANTNLSLQEALSEQLSFIDKNK